MGHAWCPPAQKHHDALADCERGRAQHDAPVPPHLTAGHPEADGFGRSPVWRLQPRLRLQRDDGLDLLPVVGEEALDGDHAPARNHVCIGGQLAEFSGHEDGRTEKPEPTLSGPTTGPPPPLSPARSRLATAQGCRRD